MDVQVEKKLFEQVNALDLFAIAIVLIIAFFFQFHGNELPCPLCLAQRFGFCMMAYGLLMNVTISLKPSNYALSAIAALFTAASSLRQMFLHIVPGTGAYGGTILGWHLYTWCFFFAGLFLMFCFFAILFDKQFAKVAVTRSETHETIARLLGALFMILLLVNVVSVFMECGIGYCPDNPMHYIHTLL